MLRMRRSIVRPCTILRAAFDRRTHLSAGKSQYLWGQVGVTFWRESLHADASLWRCSHSSKFPRLWCCWPFVVLPGLPSQLLQLRLSRNHVQSLKPMGASLTLLWKHKGELQKLPPLNMRVRAHMYACSGSESRWNDVRSPRHRRYHELLVAVLAMRGRTYI